MVAVIVGPTGVGDEVAVLVVDAVDDGCLDGAGVDGGRAQHLDTVFLGGREGGLEPIGVIPVGDGLDVAFGGGVGCDNTGGGGRARQVAWVGLRCGRRGIRCVWVVLAYPPKES